MKREQILKMKTETVKELKGLLENKKTILIASIKNIPASQYQEIGKKIRGKAIIKVPKKSLIFRAIESTKEENIKKLKESLDESFALLFSDIDGFELASELLKSKTASKAKAGQEAPEDIIIPEGPTDLMPGPAISELGALGIQVQIEKGKIHIKVPKVIAKKGEKISPGAADIMGKLDIKPFSIGLIPIAIYDNNEKKLYTEINIDSETTIKELKEAFSKAISFAVEINYTNNNTIKFILSRANIYALALESLIKDKINTQEKNTQTENKSNETQLEENK